MLTKKDVQTQLEQLLQGEKAAWANLNFLLGQKSVLEVLMNELPDDVPMEAPPEGEPAPEDNVVPFEPAGRRKKNKDK